MLTKSNTDLNVAILGQYVAAMIVVLALSTMCTVIVLTIHHLGALSGDVSPRLRRVVFEWLAKVIFRRHTVEMVLADLHAEDPGVIGHFIVFLDFVHAIPLAVCFNDLYITMTS